MSRLGGRLMTSDPHTGKGTGWDPKPADWNVSEERLAELTGCQPAASTPTSATQATCSQ